jgi:hypothetical protein
MRFFKKKEYVDPYKDYTAGYKVGNPVLSNGKKFYPVLYRNLRLPYIKKRERL